MAASWTSRKSWPDWAMQSMVPRAPTAPRAMALGARGEHDNLSPRDAVADGASACGTTADPPWPGGADPEPGLVGVPDSMESSAGVPGKNPQAKSPPTPPPPP